MNPDTIRDYLQRAEMNEAQATALSRIFGEMATRSDVVRLEDRIGAFEERMDERFRAFEQRMDERFRAFEAEINGRIGSFEAGIGGRFSTFEERMDRKLNELKAELTWKIIAVVGFIVSVGTALNIFLG